MTASTRAVTRWRAILLAAGIGLLGAAAALVWRHASAPAPYRYVPAAAQASTATTTAAGAGLERMTIVANDNDQALAEVDVARGAAGPVLVAWQALVDDPLLYMPAPADETQALAKVLARHQSPGTVVMAWWDTSRQLRHWGTRELSFDHHLGVPLFVPSRWQVRNTRVLETERAFWGEPADSTQRATFDVFARALAAPESEGVNLLRGLAAGRKALLVLHVRDMLLLGQLFPDKLNVSFRDFADSGDVHRSVRGVHGWLREGAHAAYGVIKMPQNVLRVVALKDEAAAATLAARLLPFVGNRQEDVAGLTLVHRGGAYSVFELDASPPEPAPVTPAKDPP